MLNFPLTGGAELRPIEPWQADQFAAHVAEVREHLAAWIPFASRITDADSARRMLQHFADEQARDGMRLYGIWHEDRLAGGTLFRQFDTGSAMCEIGVWIAPQLQGRGLITLAVRYMIDWAVGVRGIQRVEWHADPRNERSQAVARRLGMRLDGVLRSAFVVAGQRYDTQIWSLLASEWRLGRPGAPGSAGSPASDS